MDVLRLTGCPPDQSVFGSLFFSTAQFRQRAANADQAEVERVELTQACIAQLVVPIRQRAIHD